jgi:hypothetical protein
MPLRPIELRLPLRRQNHARRRHGAAVLNADEPIPHRILPNRHPRTGAAPHLHGLAIAAPAADKCKKLKRECGGRLAAPRTARTVSLSLAGKGGIGPTAVQR